MHYKNYLPQFSYLIPGKILKHLMWRTTTTTYLQQWESEMRNIKEVDLEAFKYLIAIPLRYAFTVINGLHTHISDLYLLTFNCPRFWARFRFTPTSKYDTLVNSCPQKPSTNVFPTQSTDVQQTKVTISPSKQTTTK